MAAPWLSSTAPNNETECRVWMYHWCDGDDQRPCIDILVTASVSFISQDKNSYRIKIQAVAKSCFTSKLVNMVVQLQFDGHVWMKMQNGWCVVSDLGHIDVCTCFDCRNSNKQWWFGVINAISRPGTEFHTSLEDWFQLLVACEEIKQFF